MEGKVLKLFISEKNTILTVSNKIAGEDWKYFDYYFGVNLTSFKGRFDVNARNKPKTKQEWIKKIKEFPQPSFPINAKSLNIFSCFKSIFNPQIMEQQ